MRRSGLVIILCLLSLSGAFPASATSTSKITPEVRLALSSSPQVEVIILLNTPPISSDADHVGMRALRQAQEQVLTALPVGAFTPTQRFDYTPALAGVLAPTGLKTLEAHNLVSRVEINEPVRAFLSEAVPFIHADRVHSLYNSTGMGVTVAVLDTGIDTGHPDLNDDLIAQKCYTNYDCQPGFISESNSAEDEEGHGTHVAGIISGKGVVSPPGFAPDASIVAVRVLDHNGSGRMSDWIKGLEWVYANRSTQHTKIINMSLGSATLYSSNCDTQVSAPVSILNLLYQAGITLFAASGNNSSSGSIASPACNSHTIAVGAVYDANVGSVAWLNCTDNSTFAGKIACFSNSNGQVDILAPGALITGPNLGGGQVTKGGTSQASPAAAGVAALMLQINPTLSPNQVLTNLRDSGEKITDTRNGLKFTLIDAEQAVSSSFGLQIQVSGPVWGLLNQALTFQSVPGAVHPTSGTIEYKWHSDLGTEIIHNRPFNQSDQAGIAWNTAGAHKVTLFSKSSLGMQGVDIYPVDIYTPLRPDFAAASRYGLATLFNSMWSTSAGENITCTWAVSNGMTHDDCGFSDMEGFILYTPGLYDVSLTIQNITGVSTLTRNRYIGVGKATGYTTPVPEMGEMIDLYPGVVANVQPGSRGVHIVFIPRPRDTVPIAPQALEHFYTFELHPYYPPLNATLPVTITLPLMDPNRSYPDELALYMYDSNQNPPAWTLLPSNYNSVTHTLTATMNENYGVLSLMYPAQNIYLPLALR